MADIVRLGFIGAGGIARAHADAILPLAGVEITAVTDAHPEAAEAMAARTGATVFPTAADLANDAGVDALYIFVPPFAHGDAERAALSANLPFFCEKPLGLDPGFLNEIASEVESLGLLTSVGYMTRYRKSVQRARALLAEEPPILAFGGWWGSTPGNHPWWTDKSKSGGQFHEQATHTVDLARYLFGEAMEVYAASAKGFNKGIPNYSMDDAVTVAVRFANGGIANLMASCSSNAGGRIFLDLHSLNQNFHFTDWNHNLVITAKDNAREEVKGEEGIFAIEDQAFINAVRSGDRSAILSPYADGVKSALLSIAANLSLETGKPVTL